MVSILLLIPFFPAQIPYKGAYDRPLTFEVLSVEWKDYLTEYELYYNKTVIGRVIEFNITIRNTDIACWKFYVSTKLYVNEGVWDSKELSVFIDSGEEKSITWTIGPEKEFIDLVFSRKEYSVGPDPPTIRVSREITKYRVALKPMIGMLPPPLYALLTAFLPVLIAGTAIWLPLYKKRFLISGTFIGGVLLLISVPLSWVNVYYGEQPFDSYSLSRYLLNLSMVMSGLRVVRGDIALGMSIPLALYPASIITWIINLPFRKRRRLLISLLFSGLFSVASVASWTYAIEVLKLEPIWGPYTPYTIEVGIGPFLGTIAGILILTSWRLSQNKVKIIK